MNECVCVCACTHRGQKSTSGVVSQGLSTSGFLSLVSWDLEPKSSKDPAISASLVLGLQAHHHS